MIDKTSDTDANVHIFVHTGLKISPFLFVGSCSTDTQHFSSFLLSPFHFFFLGPSLTDTLCNSFPFVCVSFFLCWFKTYRSSSSFWVVSLISNTFSLSCFSPHILLLKLAFWANSPQIRECPKYHSLFFACPGRLLSGPVSHCTDRSRELTILSQFSSQSTKLRTSYN